MKQPVIVLSLKAGSKIHTLVRKSDFQLWMQTFIDCPVCNRVWLHTNAGDCLHQRAGIGFYGTLKCPDCGGDALDLIGFRSNHQTLFDYDFTQIPLTLFKDLLCTQNV